MTKTFEASNGIRIEKSYGDHLHLEGEWRLYPDCVKALREYFQHEEKLKAQPWLDAKPGDVWVFEHDPSGNEQAYNVGEGPRFYRERGVEFHPKGAPIARAYRVWPTKEEE